jgi:hypothetical protein
MGSKLKTLDLFSGIGGTVRGLAGIVNVVAYCDISPICHDVLHRQMEIGTLPTAHIFEDVTKLTASDISDGVDMIIGTFPCQGMSSLGKRKALDDRRSTLFYEIMRLADDFRPKLLFFENVPNVLKDAMDVIVDELYFERGYEIRWVCMRASECGAPHERRRWFCLAIQPGVSYDFDGLEYSSYDWGSKSPARLVAPSGPRSTRIQKDRCRLLGNSVVPDTVRAAFLYLLSGFRNIDVRVTQARLSSPVGYLKTLDGTNWPQVGVISDAGAYSIFADRPSLTKSFKLQFVGQDQVPARSALFRSHEN